MRGAFEKSFWQILLIYILIVAIITANILPKYALHFELLALAIAIIGALCLNAKKTKEDGSKYMLWLAFAMIIIFRTLPYIHNPIPLGYDAGFYIAAIDQYQANSVGSWFMNWAPPGLFMLTNVLKQFSVNTEVILTTGVILIELLLGILIYLVGTEFFGKRAGAVSILLYSVSIAQYKTFTHLYLKNMLGLVLLLAAILFLNRKKYSIAALSGILLAGVHRPTFLLFGLCYLAFTATKIQNKKEFTHLIINGTIMLALGLLFYLGSFKTLVVSHLETLLVTRGGSFMTSKQYMFTTLAYLPFAFLGYLFTLKNKKFNMLFFWFTINTLIVFTRLFFYNRFVIFLDIIFILFAGYSFSQLFTIKPKLTSAYLLVAVVSMGIITGTNAALEVPNISHAEYLFMKNIPKITEENSTILSNMVDDAHWLEARAERPIIAPGLFDQGKWTKAQWTKYWHAESFDKVKNLMDLYPRPLYIYLGEKSPRGQPAKFETCTEKIAADGNMELLRYTC